MFLFLLFLFASFYSFLFLFASFAFVSFLCACCEQAARKQREREMQRLRLAQEIQRQLEGAELRQHDVELRGVAIERCLQGEEGPPGE